MSSNCTQHKVNHCGHGSIVEVFAHSVFFFFTADDFNLSGETKPAYTSPSGNCIGVPSQFPQVKISPDIWILANLPPLLSGQVSWRHRIFFPILWPHFTSIPPRPSRRPKCPPFRQDCRNTWSPEYPSPIYPSSSSLSLSNVIWHNCRPRVLLESSLFSELKHRFQNIQSSTPAYQYKKEVRKTLF